MLTYVAIGFGGALGAVLRFELSKLNSISSLPFGTLLANLLGSLLLGFFYFFFQQSNFSDTLKLAITSGFLGALTTYSTLNMELFSFLQSGNLKLFVVYFILNATIGIFAIFLGKQIADIL